MSEVLQKTNDRLDELKADGVHVSILFITSFTFAHVPLISCNELKGASVITYFHHGRWR